MLCPYICYCSYELYDYFFEPYTEPFAHTHTHFTAFVDPPLEAICYQHSRENLPQRRQPPYSSNSKTRHPVLDGANKATTMATFFQDLWESIFTPGPTPSLLIATNVTFACLQLVLLSLLVATYSIHFIVLSSLCGGLWWAINWFARELKASQKREEQETARAARATSREAGQSSDSETEVETIITRGKEKPVTGSKEVEPVEKKGELKHRTGPEVEASPSTRSGVSTDESDWEKVSENENEKDK